MPATFRRTVTAKEYVVVVSFVLPLQCRGHERPPLALRPGRRHPRRRLPGAALWHPSAGALERDPDLHGGGVPGGVYLRLLRHGLVALLREPDARRAGRPEPAASAHRARGRAADPARLLRLHAGGGQAAGARRAARGASGAAGLDPVPGQGDQHRGRRQPAPQGRGDLQEERRGGRRDLRSELHVLPRRQSRRPRALRLRPEPAASQLRGPPEDREVAGAVPLLADRQGRAGVARGIDAVELGDAGVGGSPDRRADLAGHRLSVRRDRPGAAALGDGALMRAIVLVGALASAVFLFASASPAGAAGGGGQTGGGGEGGERGAWHGGEGGGHGAGPERLAARPRDFTTGIYKIRTTVNKTPTDRDLFEVITRGMPGTFMPAWDVLPEKDRWNLVAYLKAFAADKFKEAPKKQELPKEVASSPESIRRGEGGYAAIECNKGHGAEGRADRPSRPELQG